jgi:hypothetical protein
MIDVFYFVFRGGCQIPLTPIFIHMLHHGKLECGENGEHPCRVILNVSEGSVSPGNEMLRYAQHDTVEFLALLIMNKFAYQLY